MSARHTVAAHLMDRLAELGAGRIFGVPGDYSLGMLDHVVGHPVVEWTGCTNELNAGYAADGYARLRGVAALCTTFGVGELSAINAIAGSYAEHVPVVHVVGAPALTRQALRPPVHHTLGDGEFGHFLAMHADITCARAVLTSDNAVAEIDRVLVAVRDQRLPGYLLLAADVAEAPVEQVTTPLPPPVDGTDPEALAGFTQRITRSRTIELGADAASVGAATFAPVTLPAAPAALAPLVAALPAAAAPDAPAAPGATAAADDTPLDQDTLWTEVSAALRAGDIVLADQGTCFYGMAPHRLPSGVTFVGQPLWASIGYTLPALLGVCTAAPGRRGVLLIGDGAAQTTVQELSTVMRLGLPALVVVVDNDGYTVERAIHGPDEPYNDIVRWDWTAVPAMFGGGARAAAVLATTAGELRAALAGADPDGFTLVQAVVPRDDVPELPATLTRALGAAPQP
ncbi:MAG: alpha-keto acid decarboxylase family protein [Pseudonocardiaceae bacterium]|nr:MAG: alpha-keto acid decarboxylase family protein [Pseudonocardiaceae bacterium]